MELARSGWSHKAKRFMIALKTLPGLAWSSARGCLFELWSSRLYSDQYNVWKTNYNEKLEEPRGALFAGMEHRVDNSGIIRKNLFQHQ